MAFSTNSFEATCLHHIHSYIRFFEYCERCEKSRVYVLCIQYDDDDDDDAMMKVLTNAHSFVEQ